MLLSSGQMKENVEYEKYVKEHLQNHEERTKYVYITGGVNSAKLFAKR